ncbi:MAG TPA: hypothetical protein VMI73_28565 [Trebonia sp.]|nr:hypothetical protein [Trebonia sp.]
MASQLSSTPRASCAHGSSNTGSAGPPQRRQRRGQRLTGAAQSRLAQRQPRTVASGGGW